MKLAGGVTTDRILKDKQVIREERGVLSQVAAYVKFTW